MPVERAVRVTTADGEVVVGRATWQTVTAPPLAAAAAALGRTALVLTHPYGPLGGSMDNNVVQALYDAAATAGYAVACFNFRGVRPSTGRTSWRGTGEAEDVRAVVRFLLGPTPDATAVPISAVVLVVRVSSGGPHIAAWRGRLTAASGQGYSFGAAVAANVIDELPAVVGYAGIGFPFSVLWALTLFHGGTVRDALARCRKPLLFVQGDADTFTSRNAFEAELAAVAPAAAVHWLAGCDHFFFGREDELVPLVLRWVAALPLPLPPLPDRGSAL
jgi:uncharacterized protein